MTKEVLVSIGGLQMAPDDQQDTVEVIAPGEYYNRNNKHYVLYDEVTEGFSEITKNVIKFTDGYMEVTKKGPSTVHMIFEEGKKTVTYYYTPYGGLHIGLDAKKVTVAEEEDCIKANVEYNLEINYEHVASCNIKLEVKSRDAKDFKII